MRKISLFKVFGISLVISAGLGTSAYAIETQNTTVTDQEFTSSASATANSADGELEKLLSTADTKADAAAQANANVDASASTTDETQQDSTSNAATTADGVDVAKTDSTAGSNTAPEAKYAPNTIASNPVTTPVRDVATGVYNVEHENKTISAGNNDPYLEDNAYLWNQNVRVENRNGGQNYTLEFVSNNKSLGIDDKGQVVFANDKNKSIWSIVEFEAQKYLRWAGNGTYKDYYLAANNDKDHLLYLTRDFGLALSLKFQSTKVDGIDDEYYHVKTTVNPNYALEVAGAGWVDGNNVRIWTNNGTNAQKWYVQYDQGTGFYTFRNANSAKMLDVAGNGAANGNNVDQWFENLTTAQYWRIVRYGNSYAIVSANTGKVLDLFAGAAYNSNNVDIFNSNGSAAQRWYLDKATVLNDGIYHINIYDRVFDVPGGVYDTNSRIQLFTNNDTFAQKYYFRRYGSNHTYQIENISDGYRLADVNGTVQKVWANDGAKNQLWFVAPGINGTFVLINEDTRKAIDVPGARIYNGAPLQTFTTNGSNAQRVWLSGTRAVNAGAYEFNIWGNNVEVSAARFGNGQNVAVFRSNGTSAQKWLLTDLGGNQFNVVNVATGHVLDVSGANSYSVRQWAWNESANQRWMFNYIGGGKFEIVNVGTGRSLTLTNGDIVALGRGRQDNQKFSIRNSKASAAERAVTVVNFARTMRGGAAAPTLYNATVLRDGGSVIHTYGYQCAAYVYYVFKYSGNGRAGFPATGWPGVAYNYYQARGRITWSPRPGDIVFYDWGDAPAGHRASHAAIVWWSDANGVYTIDANWGTAAQYTVFHYQTWRQYPISGFARPLYEWA